MIDDFFERYQDKSEVDLKELIKKDEMLNAIMARPPYAITCHKSQGSEWDNVFITLKRNFSFNNINDLKWLYTAVTRSRDKLFFFKLQFNDALKDYYL